MALYIHIPFCKQACSYCNFHFSTNLNSKGALVSALQKEITLRRDELANKTLQSVYFGGGTPSLLTSAELDAIFQTIQEHFTLAPDAEITLEANPDDLSEERIETLLETPVNRLSIGVQAFDDETLRFMNRAHTAEESIAALGRVAQSGFSVWTMDLIYGTPQLTPERWRENLDRVAEFGAPHLSAYQLTIESGTALAHKIQKGKAQTPDEEAIARQFDILTNWAEERGYVHYEISNLAIPGYRAVHNSSYWQRKPYLGIGPSAHSFDGLKRSWNIANNAQYLRGMEEGSAIDGSETLSPGDQYNEVVMTGLRTQEGVSRKSLEALTEDFPEYFAFHAQKFIDSGQLLETDQGWTLSRQGRLFADRIASELFILFEIT